MVSYDTGFPADSLEFCPSSSADNIFVCGTYKLDDHSTENQRTVPQHRRGQCLVFEVEDTPDDIQLRKIQAFNLPAILDMKWCHVSGGTQPLLAIADSEGHITLHQLHFSERCLTQVDEVQCATPDVLCLSLDWSNRPSSQSTPGSLIVSLSNGSLCLLRPTDASHLSLIETWHAHDHEPWIAAWNYWDTNVIYSGGDDLKLKTWDIRQGFTSPIYTNKKFDAGVTSIQCNPHIEHLIAVGCYSNTVQLFDARMPLIPLSKVDVGGGAWRVKWHPSASRKDDLLVAAMHDGFKIVRYGSDLSNPFMSSGPAGSIMKRFDAHTSLAYGADWSRRQSDKGTIVGTCSFYDHTLHLWRG